MADETTPAISDTPSDPWRRSDCCFAPVQEHIEETDSPKGADWSSVHFTCEACGNECATYTNPGYAQAVANSQGKEIQDA